MSTVEFDLLCAFEVHSVQEIRAILDAGFDVHQPIKGKSIVNSLIEMYSRSDQFPACLRLLLDRGAVLDDPRVALVLLTMRRRWRLRSSRSVVDQSPHVVSLSFYSAHRGFATACVGRVR